MTAAVDITGNGHDGTYFNGATGAPGLVPGDPDKAVLFASVTDDVMHSDDQFSAQSFTSLTVGCIITPSDVTVSTNIVSVLDSSSGGFSLLQTSGFLLFFVSDGSTAGTASFSITDGVTYRVVGVWDGTDVILYVNGVAQDTEAYAGPVSTASARFFCVGEAQSDIGGFNSFNGVIDEVFYIDSDLSSGDVTVVDNAMTGTGDVQTTILGLSPYLYYRMGDLDIENTETDVTFTNAVGITNVLTVISSGIGILYTVTKPDTCGDPSYSPDGTKVVFQEKIGSTYQVSHISSAGSGHTVLTSGSQPYADPYYSSDGNFIVFAVQTAAADMDHPYGKWALKYMRFDGAQLTTILDDGNANLHPTWASPTQIAFQNFRYGVDDIFQISIIDVAGRGRMDLGDGEYPRVVTTSE